MKIYVMVLNGVFDTGLSSLLDTLAMANHLASQNADWSVEFDVTVLGTRQRVLTNNGLRVPVVSPRGLPTPDVLLIPGLAVASHAAFKTQLASAEVHDAQAWISRWSAAGCMTGSACTGVFVLAGTGLLAAREATTTWWMSPLFREMYPQVQLDESRMLVSSGRFITVGAAMAHLDLAFWLVRQHSPALATLTARYLVVDSHPSQAAFVIPDQLAHMDPLVERFERWARGQLADGFSLSAAARASGTSERTLARRLRLVLGKSPLSYFQDLRVERAIHLLQTSASSIDKVATEVGYADGVTLRTLLRRKIGLSVRELRARRVG